MRKRIVRVMVTAAITLGLLAGSGLIGNPALSVQASGSAAPCALQGGGSNGY